MVVDIPWAEYRALDRANASTLWKMLQSPKRAKWEMDHPTAPSEQMKLGTLGHSMVTGKDAPVVRPATANRRSNEGKANLVMWLESITGHKAPIPPASVKTTSARLDFQISALEPIAAQSSIDVVTQDQVDTAEQMRDSLMSKPTARVLFESGRGELTCLQEDEQTGLDLKARWDWVPSLDDHILTDIKTGRSASYDDFSASCARYGYHLQAAFYSWLYELEYGFKPAFFFAVVENSPPFDSAIFQASEDMLEQGRRLFRRALNIYADCRSRNFWPGADYDWSIGDYMIRELELPRWVNND